MAMRYRVVLALAAISLVSLTTVRMADGEVPTGADVAACNQEAPEAIKVGAAWPTVGDRARADRARAGGETVGSTGFTGTVIESSNPQIHGMAAEGAKDATYQAAYRGCMRRKGF